MVNGRQPDADVRVIPRDREALRALLQRHSYRAVAEKVGCSKTSLGYLANGQRTTVPLSRAGRIEHALDQPAGALFRLDPDTAARTRPYLH